MRKGLTALAGAALIGALAVAHHTGMIDIPAPEGSPSEASGDSSPKAALDQLDELLVQDEHEDGYDRSLFPHWDNSVQGNCTTRDWMPPNQDVHCEYVTAWIEVKHTWDLTVDPDEEQALHQVLASC